MFTLARQPNIKPQTSLLTDFGSLNDLLFHNDIDAPLVVRSAGVRMKLRKKLKEHVCFFADNLFVIRRNSHENSIATNYICIIYYFYYVINILTEFFCRLN